jgi:hypothetical protein
MWNAQIRPDYCTSNELLKGLAAVLVVCVCELCFLATMFRSHVWEENVLSANQN